MSTIRIEITDDEGNGLIRTVGFDSALPLKQAADVVVAMLTGDAPAAAPATTPAATAATTPAAVAPTPAPTQSPAAASSAPVPGAEAEKPPTHEDLRQALRAWQTSDPKNQAGKFLKEQGFDNVSSIPADKIAQVLSALRSKA